jgi:hypothetical protein
MRTNAADRRRYHDLGNNFAAMRLWLMMLEESSCAKCRRAQADAIAGIHRNLTDMQASLAGRLPNAPKRSPRRAARRRR